MTVSKEIIEAPCVIFLGAGASKVVGLMLMKEFVDNLKSSNVPERKLFDAICKQKGGFGVSVRAT